MTPAGLIAISGTIAIILLILAMLAATLRVMIGPTLADRVLALDMLVAIAIGFIALIAIQTGHDLYIDIALALGLVGFLATIALARFIDTRTSPSPPPLSWPSRPAKRRERKKETKSNGPAKGGGKP